jgi:murein DD-endopeptidase MepM/ murein hydrolase activator NlpD
MLVVSEGSALLASAGVATDEALEKLDEADEPAEKAEKKAEVKTAKQPAVKAKAKAAAPKAPAKKAAAKPTVKKLSGAGYFGNPLPGGRKSQGIHGNNAVDISAPTGTPIYAAAAGRISVAKCDGGYNSGWGSYIKIAHGNGSQTLYAHMSRCAVSGGSVAKGQLIGYVGTTGKVTGAHLHFETYGATNPLR